MLFGYVAFAYTPSHHGGATGEATPVYPSWLLAHAQATLAALADKALEREIEGERMIGFGERSHEVNAVRLSGLFGATFEG